MTENLNFSPGGGPGVALDGFRCWDVLIERAASQLVIGRVSAWTAGDAWVAALDLFAYPFAASLDCQPGVSSIYILPGDDVRLVPAWTIRECDSWLLV